MMPSKSLGPAFLLLALCFAALAGAAQTAEEQAVRESRNYLSKGAKSFAEQKYDEAAQFFEKAVQLDPQFDTARMYLATAHTSQFIPGSNDPKSEEAARKAIETFRYVAERPDGPHRITAMIAIANLYYQLREYPESRGWCTRVLKADPERAEAYYRIAVMDLDYSLEKTGVQGELVESMSPDQIRETEAAIDEGLKSLGKALEIRPTYFDAMEYESLLWREKVKLEKDEKARAEFIHEADKVLEKARSLKNEANRIKAKPGN